MVIGVDKGVEQEMEETKQIYLLVVSGKFYFLVPLFCVIKVTEERKAGDGSGSWLQGDRGFRGCQA